MTTTATHDEASLRTKRKMAIIEASATTGSGPHLTGEQVWLAVSKESFAIVGYVTPTGEPRSSGVVYKTLAGRMYVATAPDSWKAKHVSKSHRMSVTVPVRRGGLLSLIFPIPPATVSFHGTAVVHPAGSPDMHQLLEALGRLLPPERRDAASIIEIVPTGMFVTYGIGVPLMKMRDPKASRARVPVG